MKHVVVVASVLLALVVPSFGQNEEKDVVLPDHVMKDVVTSILKFYFKPGRSRFVNLSESNIKESWIPQIRNVRFALVKESSTELQNLNGFIFNTITRNDRGIYFVTFGFGALGCGDRTGDYWSFRISAAGKVQALQLSGYGWGSACSTSP